MGTTFATHPADPMSRRRWLAVAAGSAALLPACGAQSGQPAADQLQVKPGVTVRVHMRGGENILEHLMPQFEAEHKVKVQIEPLTGTGDYYQKLQVLQVSGSAADVYWGSSDMGAGHLWVHQGLIRLVDDLVARDKLATSEYFPAAIDAVQFEKKLYAIPYKFQPSFVALYFNQNQLASDGIAPPDGNKLTYDELAQLSAKLTRPGENGTRFGLMASGLNPTYQQLACFARAWGTDLLTDDGKKSQLAQPKVLEALQWNYNLIHRLNASPKTGETADFTKGTLAMSQGGSWNKSYNNSIKDFTVRNTLMPKGRSGKRGSMGITDFKVINKATPHVAESWALMKFLTGKDFGVMLGEGLPGQTTSATSGGRKDVFNHERLLANPLHKIFIEAAESAMPVRVPWNFQGTEYANALQAGISPMLKGETPLGMGQLADLDRRLQQILDQPRPGK